MINKNVVAFIYSSLDMKWAEREEEIMGWESNPGWLLQGHKASIYVYGVAALHLLYTTLLLF